jgi:hypothetical protein
MRIVTVVAVTGIALAGCASPELAQPTVHAQDANLDCTMIHAEIEANNAKVTELADDQGWTLKQWYRYGKDFKYETARDAAALNARQEHLAALEAEKCAPPSAPEPPPRQRRAKS